MRYAVANTSYDYFLQIKPDSYILEEFTNSSLNPGIFSKKLYELSEDVEICASIFIDRLQDNEARVRVLTIQPEESCVYIFGTGTLPRKLEERFGTVQSIQGQQREDWIYR
jgi:hypothetical protein